MYCIKCGKELAPEDSYCAHCGSAVQIDLGSSSDKQNVLLKVQRVDEICKIAYGHFEKKAQFILQAKQCSEKAKSRKFVLNCVFILVAAMACFVSIIPVLSLPFFWVPVVLILLLILSLIYSVLYFPIVAPPKREAKHLETLGFKEQNTGEDFLIQNVESLLVLPQEYWYPLATEFIVKLFVTGRVDSLRQAIEKFEEQKQRWTVENAYSSVLEQQKHQTEILKELQVNANITAITFES